MGYLKSFALLALASAGVVGSAKPSANAPGILGLRGLVNGAIPLSTEPESYWTTPAPPPENPTPAPLPANPPQDRPRTPPPALAQYLDPARPGTPAPAQPRTPAPPQASSSNFPVDSVVGPVVALFILAIIGYPVFRHIRHERNRIPIPEIPMATITNERNVVAPQPNSLLGTIQEDLRVTRDNVLPHRQLVYNAIPTPTSLPSYNGIRGVPLLNPQIQQPHPGPVASSAPQQQTSNLGQGLHLQPREIRHDTGVGASLVFADTAHASRQQPASENPDNAPQASASSRIPSSSPLNIQSPPRHTDIPPGPPPQYR